MLVRFSFGVHHMFLRCSLGVPRISIGSFDFAKYLLDFHRISLGFPLGFLPMKHGLDRTTQLPPSPMPHGLNRTTQDGR